MIFLKQIISPLLWLIPLIHKKRFLNFWTPFYKKSLSISCHYLCFS
jgi:hypothetical protein